MKESKTYGDRQLIFRDGLLSEQETRSLGAVPTAVTYSNGVATFNGSTSKIVYPTVSGVLSVRLIFTPGTTTQNILKLSSTHSISVSAGTVAGTGFASPTIYVNGVAGSTITATKVEVVITTATAIRAKDIQLGFISTYLTGTVELMECYNTVLSSQDCKNLFEGTRLKAPKLDKDEQLGPEMVVDGGFDAASKWTAAAGWTVSGSKANYDDATNATSIAPAVALPFTLGKRYRVTYTISGLTGNAYIFFSNQSGAAAFDVWPTNAIRVNNTYSETWLCTAAATNFRIYAYTVSGSAWSLDNLSIKEVLVERTRVIADISAVSGAIANRLSGNAYNELVTNAADREFSSDTGYWTKGTGSTIADGVVHVVNAPTAGFNSVINVSITTTGKRYQITYTILNYVSGGIAWGGNTLYESTRNSNGTFTITFTADSPRILLYINTIGTTLDIDNISVKEVIPAVVNTAMSVSKQGEVTAMSFNGTTSLVDVGSYDTMVGDKTFVFVFRLKTYGTTGLGRLLHNGKLVIFPNYSTKTIAICSDASTLVYSATNSILLKNIYHLIITRTNAGIVNIYINGVLSGTANQSSGTPIAGTTNNIIGAASTGTSPFDGLISHVRIIDGILSAQEIAQIWSSERGKYNI